MYYVNVNRNTIFSNVKHGRNEPPISVQKGKRGIRVYCHQVKIKEGELIYSPSKPILKCGARLVIQTDIEPEITR